MSITKAVDNPGVQNIPIVPVPENKDIEKWRSQSDRTIIAQIEGSDETIGFAAKRHTTVREIKELVAEKLQTTEDKVILKKRLGNRLVILKHEEECVSNVVVSGLKSFTRKVHQFEHPIIVVGAGLGGVQCTMDLLERGRKDVICIEKHKDFGGHSWIKVPNKYTKLQTERGTYHINYLAEPFGPIPRQINEHMAYPTWPSRDTILTMMREGARRNGLYEYTMFGVELEKITPKKNAYALHWLPHDDDEGDGGLIMGGAVNAWPGFLHLLNTCEWPGEDDFGGYIEYSSFDRVDYTQATGKVVLMYGHGAFSIENVRTLCEHRCKKVYVACRYRNICGTKMTSWLVGYLPVPTPGTVLVDSLQRMYDLADYNLWTESPSITTNASRSYAMFKQATIFGVTDIYFLAAYYGLMEVVVDEVSRLSHHKVVMKGGRKIECEMIIKAIGTSPSWKVGKQLGIKEVVGTWVNGDPFRPCNLSGKGVSAQNFGSFSIGPGLAPAVKIHNWFLDYPEDYEKIKNLMPINTVDKWPGFVCTTTYLTSFTTIVQQVIPDLGLICGDTNLIKARKHQESHPLPVYLAAVKKEWEAYIQYFKDNNMVDDRPDPEYPYTEKMCQGFIDDSLKKLGMKSADVPRTMLEWGQ